MLIRAATSNDNLAYPGGMTKARAMRKTSDQEFFPWNETTTPFIHIPQGSEAFDSVVSYMQEAADKLALLDSADPEDVILAVWPGKMRSDVFLVDDREQATDAIAAGAIG